MSKFLLVWSVLWVSLLLTWCGWSSSWDTYSTQSVDGADEVATCLSEKWAKMYGTEWCGYCKKQKEAFGSAFSSVAYIDCDENPSACAWAGVEWFPTRVINGQNYPWKRELWELKSLAGC